MEELEPLESDLEYARTEFKRLNSMRRRLTASEVGEMRERAERHRKIRDRFEERQRRNE